MFSDDVNGEDDDDVDDDFDVDVDDERPWGKRHNQSAVSSLKPTAY